MIKIKHLFLLTIFTLSSFAFAQKFALPEFYGFYLIDNEQLVELKANKSLLMPLYLGYKSNTLKSLSGINSKNLSPSFILYEKGLETVFSMGEKPTLKKLLYVQRDIMLERGFNSPIKEIKISDCWKISNEVINLKIGPISKDPDMVRLVPDRQLSPGAYCYVISENEVYDFTINFEQYNKESEALDRVCSSDFMDIGLQSAIKYFPYGEYAPPGGEMVRITTEKPKSFETTVEKIKASSKYQFLSADEKHTKLLEILDNAEKRIANAQTADFRNEITKRENYIKNGLELLQDSIELISNDLIKENIINAIAKIEGLRESSKKYFKLIDIKTDLRKIIKTLKNQK
jgi:hypothetical protein